MPYEATKLTSKGLLHIYGDGFIQSDKLTLKAEDIVLNSVMVYMSEIAFKQENDITIIADNKIEL